MCCYLAEYNAGLKRFAVRRGFAWSWSEDRGRAYRFASRQDVADWFNGWNSGLRQKLGSPAALLATARPGSRLTSYVPGKE